jgi:hypothetical protein
MLQAKASPFKLPLEGFPDPAPEGEGIAPLGSLDCMIVRPTGKQTATVREFTVRLIARGERHSVEWVVFHLCKFYLSVPATGAGRSLAARRRQSI